MVQRIAYLFHLIKFLDPNSEKLIAKFPKKYDAKIVLSKLTNTLISSWNVHAIPQRMVLPWQNSVVVKFLICKKKMTHTSEFIKSKIFCIQQSQIVNPFLQNKIYISKYLH